MPPFLRMLFIAGCLALAGCGGASDETADGDDVASADAATDGPRGDDATPADDGHEPADDLRLDVARLDPVARGIEAENARLREAVQKIKAADGDRELLVALSAIDIERLDGVGAGAAGLTPREYRVLRDALYEHLGAIEMRDAMKAQYAAVDTSAMDAATAAEAERVMGEVLAAVPDPYAGLDPDLAEALQARQDELMALRSTHIGLLFEAADL